MAQATLRRDDGAEHTLDVYWWELYIAYARREGWEPHDWEATMVGSRPVPAAEAERLAQVLDRILAGPPPSDAMPSEHLAALIEFLRQGGFTLDIGENVRLATA
jgi:hypothetical protein